MSPVAAGTEPPVKYMYFSFEATKSSDGVCLPSSSINTGGMNAQSTLVLFKACRSPSVVGGALGSG